MVVVIADISKKEGGSIELLISDGSYLLKSVLRPKGDGVSNDDKIIQLVNSKKLYVGMKIHMIN